MNRLEAIFARVSDERRLVIPYICAGDPDVATSRAVLLALADAGAEIVELGIPFGDPVGDGGTIAMSSQRALRAGMTMRRTLNLCASVQDGPAIVLFGYLNPIVRYGVHRFAAEARRAGVCGVIIVDLPYEETTLVAQALHYHGIALIMLVSPTTPLERALRIAQTSDTFVYVISRLGVTGASREPDFDALTLRLRTLRDRTDRPIAAGFGISNAVHAGRIAAHADAIVVGSALVDAIAGRTGNDAAAAARAFFEPLVAAVSPSSTRYS
jgi:tryptophan synthase alpha chain